jgi:hypothetical protein
MGSYEAMHFCVVTRDLNRYLAEQDRADRFEEYKEHRFDKIRADLETWPKEQWSEYVQSDCLEDWEEYKAIAAECILKRELQEEWDGN